ncbi:HAMP domain-containing histidine kinase [Comamonas sp. Tr-654]|nr:HAMP domain-containing histidine kinase [Comamonas sp. Tr-654]
MLNPRSLRWQLTLRLTVTQAAILVAVQLLFFAAYGIGWYLGYLNNGMYDWAHPQAIANAIHRNEDGNLRLEETEELRALRASTPGFWFVARDMEGRQLSEGQPPALVADAVPLMDLIAYADLGQDGEKSAPALATVQWADSRLGKIKVMSAAGGRVTVEQILRSSSSIVALTLYLGFIAVIAVLLATPFVVRRAFRGLDSIAEQTEQIDIEQMGTRLSTRDVPLEITPFVKAVNDALVRLDKGYEGHKRFLADAAHEMRTPIAILTTRLAALPQSPLKSRLLEDSTRLTAIAGQLLDLQRMEQQKVAFQDVDLVELAERVVMDLAPLAFGAGYELSFEPEAELVFVLGDAVAIERAITNIVQNAINYGGREGTILVRVASMGWVEVCDEGPGIPEADREQVFEAFHRLKQDGRGVGLGLDLVQKVMHLHGGRVELAPRKPKGACFRLVFPGPLCV